MADNESNIRWTINPLVKPGKRSKRSNKRSKRSSTVSTWFVNNQKSKAWDQKALDMLHLGIIVSLVVVYTCHVIGSPFISFIEDQTALTILYVLETFVLVISILCFVKMCQVNGSWTVFKLLFHKTNARTGIFAFWLLRSFVSV